jgi:hypothetical protein
MWFQNLHILFRNFGMLIQVDFCLIVVSKLHMWFQNYICCFETTLKNVETTYHHVEKVSYKSRHVVSNKLKENR